MGPSTTQTAEDDSSGRLPPEPLDDPSRPSIPTVGILRRATNLTTSSSSTEPLSLGDERNYSKGTRPPFSWDFASTQFITPSPNTSKGVDVPGCWRRQVVLSLDGGDIRAYSELCILERIFREVARVERSYDGARSSESSPLFGSPDAYDEREFSKDNPATITDNYLPCHYFDYVGGTSMGGVVAVMLGRLRLPINKAIRYFEEMWISISSEGHEFHSLLPRRRIRAGHSKGLRKALDGIVAKPNIKGVTIIEPFRSDSSLCKTMVLAVQIDRARGVRRPYIFRSYVFNEDKPTAMNRNKSNKTQDTPLKDVCLATSAAPSFFESVKIDNKKFRDGSIWMTNPSMELYREVCSMHPDQESPIYCLVSIGCGKQKRSRILPSINMPATSSYKREQQQVHDVLKLRKKEGEIIEYTRFAGPTDLTDVKPSDWKLEENDCTTFDRIRAAAARYCDTSEVKQKIEEIAVQLVKYRRQRARTAHWERFALGVRYSCNWCEDSTELVDRDDVIGHVKIKHKDREVTGSRFFNEYRKVLEEFRVPTSL